MKSAVYKIQGLSNYIVLLPDHTVATATKEILRAFLTKFKDADTLPILKNGDQGKWQDDDPLIRKPTSLNCAYITDTGELVIYDFTPFNTLFEHTFVPRSYVSTVTYAQKHKRTSQQIKSLCNAGRFPTAIKVAGRWAIPEDAPYPEDGRMTAGGMYVGVHRKQA